MIYKKHEYGWVNEKEYKGILYTAWRSNDNPKKCLITYENEKVEVDDLKKTWEAIN